MTTELEILNAQEWTNTSGEILKALKRLDANAVRDTETTLKLIVDIVGAIDNAFEERYMEDDMLK